MELRALLSIEGAGWVLIALGWMVQMYFAYGKRSTRVSKQSLVLLLMGFLALVIARWLNGFSAIVIVQLVALFMLWLVYVRRK